jgi:AcrR family transcriptional regulator
VARGGRAGTTAGADGSDGRGDGRGAGRARLSRAAVVAAATELADDGGLAALSMRSVAGHLGVEAMSLYHHVRNKDDLLDGMVDAVFGEFHCPRPGAPWREELRARSVSGRAVLRRHRWAVGLMDSRSAPGLETLRHHDAMIGCLREAGFGLPLTAHALALLDAHLYGHMVQELSLPFEGASELETLADSILEGLPEGQLPHFREFALEHALQPGYAFADEFEWGLDLVLDGLARRLAESR